MKLFAKNYLRQELVRINPEADNPEANLNTLKDFETFFREKVLNSKLSWKEKYSIVVLYLGIK